MAHPPLEDIKHIHMTGIGGIGMSALADIMREQGVFISGSDMKENRLIEKLTAKGCRINIGHKGIYGQPDILVRSFSVRDDNPEVSEARARGIPVVERSELLRALINSKPRTVSVCGTHGKTTTTAMISYIMEKAGLDPTVLIGGLVQIFEGNAKTGKSDIFVTETDESDGFIRTLRPRYMVITNIEKEHMEHYKTMANLLAAFREFISSGREDGAIFYCADDKILASMARLHPGKKTGYGFGAKAYMRASGVREKGYATEFILHAGGKKLGKVKLNMPGRHNVLNAMAAIGMTMELGVSFEVIAGVIGGFSRVKRRFEVHHDTGGITLVEDYAHHPTEIKAVISMARALKPKRVIAVFQPHRYTRTRSLEKEFGPAFKGVDRLLLTDIYPANETPIKGVSSVNILKRVKACGLRKASLVKKDEVKELLKDEIRPGDTVLVMGAGDINGVIPSLADICLCRQAMAGLPSIFGRVIYYEDLSRHTTFGIGGRATAWAEPVNVAELRKLVLFASRKKIPVFVIGWGSNVLFRDKGFEGLVIRLNRDMFADISISGNSLKAGAGAMLGSAISAAQANSLGGFEGLVGIPGTIGGALRMNAGYKQTAGDIVSRVTVMDIKGKVTTLDRKKIKFYYRGSSLSKYIILSAVFELREAPRDGLRAMAARLMDIKRGTQPLEAKSAGCVFKNPRGAGAGAGMLIDKCGLKGMCSGGARVSEKHANFIINTGNATCKDVLHLIESVKDKVRLKTGVELEEEILLI